MGPPMSDRCLTDASFIEGIYDLKQLNPLSSPCLRFGSGSGIAATGEAFLVVLVLV